MHTLTLEFIFFISTEKVHTTTQSVGTGYKAESVHLEVAVNFSTVHLTKNKGKFPVKS